MALIDTHCHIDLPVFAEDRDQVLQRAFALGVQSIVVPAIEQQGWRSLYELCTQYADRLFPALGLHPVFVQRHEHRDLLLLKEALRQPNIVAVGEIGLDFFVRELPREKQIHLFTAQLELAAQTGLPVIMHVRKAYDEVIAILREHPVKGGIAHAFNGSLQQADKLIDMGFKLGFGGTMTYANARRIHGLASKLPLDAIVLETDAPDMVVEAHRGGRNSPEYLPLCLQALAKLRNADQDSIAMATTNNARQVLGLV